MEVLYVIVLLEDAVRRPAYAVMSRTPRQTFQAIVLIVPPWKQGETSNHRIFR